MKRAIIGLAMVCMVFSGAVLESNAAAFLDDFSTDTSANYTTTTTYGGAGASFNIGGGTLNVVGNGGSTFDVFHKNARLEIGETVSVDLDAGNNNIYLCISTTDRGPNTGTEDGIRLNWTGTGTFRARVYNSGSGGDTAFGGTVTAAPIKFYITRTADTVYTAGYDAGAGGTGELTGISIPGTAGQGLYIGVETFAAGTRNFDNLQVKTSGAVLPVITSFTATPSSLPEGGGEVVFAWTATDATTVTLDGDNVTGQSPLTNTVSTSKAFDLVATNSEGSDSESVSVTVASSIFLDDFNTDTSADYTGTLTYGDGAGTSFNVGGGTLNVGSWGNSTYDVFHNTARLKIGETASIDLVSGADDVYLTVSTINRGPNTGSEDGIRLNWTSSGTMKGRVYNNGSATDSNFADSPTAPFTFFITRDTDTTYSYGYDGTTLASGVGISGTAGQELHVGVEIYGAGTRAFDNLEVKNRATAPAITSFTATPDSLEETGAVTLAWTTVNAVSTTLNGETVTGSSAVRMVSAPTEFTLVATASGGATASKTVSVAFGKTFSIAVVADPQYSDKPNGGGREPIEGLPRLQHAVSEYNKRDLDWGIILGDIVNDDDIYYTNPPDCSVAKAPHDWEFANAILEAWHQLNAPTYLVLGNHDYYVPNKDVDGLSKPASVWRKFGFDQERGAYYSFRHKGFRFVALEVDWRYLNHDPADADGEYAVSQAYYDDFSAWSKYWWNGAISIKQRLWLMELLDESLALNEPVVCMAHDPIAPTSNPGHDLFNKVEMQDILYSYPNVVMWMDGHDHSGSSTTSANGLHFLNLRGMQDEAENWYQLDFTPESITVYKAENTNTPDRVLDVAQIPPTVDAPSGFSVAESSGDAVLTWATEPVEATSVVIERRHVTPLRAELPSTAQTLAWGTIYTDTALMTQSYTDNPPNPVAEYKYRIRFLGGAEGSRHSQALAVGESEKDVPYVELGEEAQQFDSTTGAPMTCTLSYGSNTLYGMSILMNRELGGEWITLSEDVDYKITATESWTPEGSSQPLTRATLELADSSSFLLAGDEPIFIKAVFNLPVE